MPRDFFVWWMRAEDGGRGFTPAFIKRPDDGHRWLLPKKRTEKAAFYLIQLQRMRRSRRGVLILPPSEIPA